MLPDSSTDKEDEMTQEERRIWLIDYLRSETNDLKEMGIPGEEQGQKNMLRALMNIREAKPIGEDFLKIQDDYLTWEAGRRGIVEVDSMSYFGKNSRIYLWQGDITRLNCDAIVNSANTKMRGCFIPLHNCVDNHIHSRAGVQLRLKCDEIMRKQGHDEPVGSAKVTPAYNLPCEHIIHVAGPVVEYEIEDEHRQQLKQCYITCLEVAELYEIDSIAFCSISAGENLFPKEAAARIAIDTVMEYIQNHDRPKQIIFTVADDENLEIYTHLLSRVC